MNAESRDESDYARLRRGLARELEREGITDPLVLAAIAAVPRHEFVPLSLRAEAYLNYPLPIGYGQTISQPYIVALMSELARVTPGTKVLVVGTGSGYQDAILAQMGAEVHSVEIVEALAIQARRVLQNLGLGGVEIHIGDGHRGWPPAAPYDAIVVTAAPARVPVLLLEQLAEGGRLVIPVGDGDMQRLSVLVRRGSDFQEQDVAAVRFVPMTGLEQMPS